MVMDDQENVQRPVPAAASRPGKLLREAVWALGILALAGAVAIGYRWLRHMDVASATEKDAPPPKPAAKPIELFKRWPHRKPDVAFLLTGEQFGYNQPCGCSYPQYGGVARRWNFIEKELKGRGWPVVALDLGDVAQRSGPQTKLKYVYSMKALKMLGYHAMGVGLGEFGIPLPAAIDNYALNEGEPWHLAANLKDEQGALLGLVKPAYLVDDVPIKIGVIGIVGPSVAKEVRDPAFANKFLPTQQALQPANKDMAQKGAEILVLLYQGTLEEAKALAANVPQYAVILSLSKEEEPREDPVKVGNTLIINVGHKGRKVGVLGVFRNPKGSAEKFEFHYELCSIGPEYQTPDDKPSNRINELMEDYAKEVKGQNFLAQHARTKHPIQLNAKYAESKYVGADKCKKCHAHAYAVWEKSPHAHSYKTLVDAKRPGLRQYDPECARCHVTGLDYVSGFQNETASLQLKDNGCENCHGPASMHLKNTADAELHALMNPYKTPANEQPAARAKRLLALDQSCARCHDMDNDVNWNLNKWDKIVHKEKPGTGGEPAPAAKP